MRFVLLMAMRELRASWRRLLFFFVCVAIGVGAIVALRSMIQSIRSGLVGQARALMASDVSISTNRPWTPELRADLDRRLARAPIAARQESVEMTTMVRPAPGKGAPVARMVELRGVEAGFPFYGTITLADGRAFSHDLLTDHGALVRPELLAQLGLDVGDRIVIGGTPFTIRGLISEEPGRRVGAFSFGSRVLVDLADLRATGLLSFGSRANYAILLKMADAGVQPLVDELRRDFRDRFVSVRSYRATEDHMGEDFQRAENQLSLIGFVILVLGGIGVWSVTRVFVRQKIKSVAILKCVGATTRQVLAAYVVQVLLLGLIGSLLGVGLARIALAFVPASLAATLGLKTYGLTLSAVVQGVSVGILVSLLFSLVPLLEVRRVKPLLLMRGDTAGGAVLPAWWRFSGVRARVARIDVVQAATGAVVAAALIAIASWQAASLRTGVVVCVGFAAAAFVLHIASSAVVYAVRPFAHARSFAVRHAVLSLGRPGNQTRVILLAVGLGSFFVIGVRSLQSNLVAQFSLQLSAGGADMFLIEILPPQVDSVRAFLDARRAAGSEPARLMPVLRARVTGIRGRDTNLDTYEDVRREGGIGREFTITYRDELSPNETIVSGSFWGRGSLPPGAPAEVSVEKQTAEEHRINVGDTIRFDVLGRLIEAKVTSIRQVDWQDARNGGFIFVFRPGPFATAPQTWIGILHAPEDPTARGLLQRDIVAKFPNVSVIDLREILATIKRAVDNVTTAISVVGAVAVVSGILILIGAVAMTKFQRIYEAAILRTLGASTRTLGTLVAVEYSGLGLLAGVIGAGGGAVFSWAVCRHVFDIPWHPAPGVAITGAGITTLLVGIVGVVASYDVLTKKPLGTLRAE